jgi:hypothetical protein
MPACILVAGFDSDREQQLQREWFASHLRVPPLFRRTGEGALKYLKASQDADALPYPRSVMLVLNWPLSDMPAFLVVKQIRRHPTLRELLIIASHPGWVLSEQRLAYSCGVDCCVDSKTDFSNLIHQVRRIEDFWLKHHRNIWTNAPADSGDRAHR